VEATWQATKNESVSGHISETRTRGRKKPQLLVTYAGQRQRRARGPQRRTQPRAVRVSLSETRRGEKEEKADPAADPTHRRTESSSSMRCTFDVGYRIPTNNAHVDDYGSQKQDRTWLTYDWPDRKEFEDKDERRATCGDNTLRDRAGYLAGGGFCMAGE
jgi:hypothetical protein